MADATAGVGGSTRHCQPDQGQRRGIAHRNAQAEEQHLRIGGLGREYRGIDWLRRQGPDRRRYRRIAAKALAALGGEPITHLINTHWHFDHTDGNAWLNSSGAKIIAQENTRKYLSEVQRVDDWDYNFLPLPPNGLPSEVFATEHGLKLNGSSIALKHYGPAHTDSDISVTFGEADIVHVADTYWNGIYPFIDHSTGGSIDGMIAASDANLAARRTRPSSFRGTERLSATELNSRNSVTCL
jgi:glyoxylase-like metal-dependent hydrolase (beta-lactamase superfamily II)